MTVEPTPYLKPLPRTTPETAPFWEACRRHSLELQRCSNCGQFWFPPGNRCTHCLSDQWAWTPVSGRGEVYTFTVYHRAYQRGFTDEIPYAVAVVQLEEGPRMLSNIVGCPVDDIRIGMAVSVVFEDVAEDATLFKFQPR